MPNNQSSAVLTVLSRHIGSGNGIAMKQLQMQLDMVPRHLRKLVSELRGEGHAICGTPGEGYFIAATAEELQHTCEFLRSRAMHSLSLESKLRKIPLSDLLGQLHLPT
jgi:hypothetical protein